jgi:hypothetical protein
MFSADIPSGRLTAMCRNFQTLDACGLDVAQQPCIAGAGADNHDALQITQKI